MAIKFLNNQQITKVFFKPNNHSLIILKIASKVVLLVSFTQSVSPLQSEGDYSFFLLGYSCWDSGWLVIVVWVWKQSMRMLFWMSFANSSRTADSGGWTNPRDWQPHRGVFFVYECVSPSGLCTLHTLLCSDWHIYGRELNGGVAGTVWQSWIHFVVFLCKIRCWHIFTTTCLTWEKKTSLRMCLKKIG